MLAVLKKYADFRLIFISQFVSFLGSMVSYVVVPYQIYELTKSSFMVGMLAIAQLLPVLFFAIIGGSLADRQNRRTIIIICEALMAVCALGLAINSYSANPSLIIIFVLIFILQAASAYHRPALEAMTQQIVEPADFPAVAALGSLNFAITAMVGPAFGGWALIAWGTSGAYVFDFATFAFSLICAFFLSRIPTVVQTEQHKGFLPELKESLSFTKKNPSLAGSYIVDILAMTFAFPIALLPEIVEKNSYPEMIGWMYAAMAMGALVITIFFSKPILGLQKRGQIITIAAGVWGLGILFFGFSLQSAYLSIFFLAIAGAADTVSGLQRRVLWNEVIPNNIRGKMAGLEMISYMIGPLLGNFRAGYLAGFMGASFSIISGGIMCVFGVILCARFLPEYWNYKSQN